MEAGRARRCCLAWNARFFCASRIQPAQRGRRYANSVACCGRLCSVTWVAPPSETLGVAGRVAQSGAHPGGGGSLHLPRLQQSHILLLRQGSIAVASGLADTRRLLRCDSNTWGIAPLGGAFLFSPPSIILRFRGFGANSETLEWAWHRCPHPGWTNVTRRLHLRRITSTVISELTRGQIRPKAEP